MLRADARQFPCVEQQADSLLLTQPSNEQRAASQWLGFTGVGNDVGADEDLVIRNTERAEMIGNVVTDRQEAIDHQPCAAMGPQRGCHRDALQLRVAIATVLDRRPRERLADAIRARMTIAEVQAVGTHVAVVVHCLHYRHAHRLGRPHDPWRDQRVGIVEMNDVRLHLTEQPSKGNRVDRRHERANADPGLADCCETVDLVAVADVREDLDTVRLERGDVGIDDAILARRLCGSIPVVDDDDPHVNSPRPVST